jgi:hypothetical protein
MMNAMLMERAGMAGLGAAGMTAGGMAAPGAAPAGVNMMMVPRCTVKVEKCNGGMTAGPARTYR